jgi:hypothetical protein
MSRIYYFTMPSSISRDKLGRTGERCTELGSPVDASAQTTECSIGLAKRNEPSWSKRARR